MRRDLNFLLDSSFLGLSPLPVSYTHLTLPEDVEKDKIEAKVDNGVLHITLPRTQKAEKETKKIEVA